jgi:hypothetical protein
MLHVNSQFHACQVPSHQRTTCIVPLPAKDCQCDITAGIIYFKNAPEVGCCAPEFGHVTKLQLLNSAALHPLLDPFSHLHTGRMTCHGQW